MFTLHSKTTKRHAPHWESIFLSEAPSKRIVHAAHTTAYDRHDLATSVYHACMKAFGFAGEAEDTAVQVCKRVEAWLANKEEVTRADIKRQAARALQLYNPRAAYEYAPEKEYTVTEDSYGFIRL